MSGSSPDDLAVAFRSIPRRLADALEPVGGDRAVAAAELAAVDALVDEIARLLGIAAATPAALAHEVESRRPEAWVGGDLAGVQALALRIGPLVRAVADAAERAAH